MKIKSPHAIVAITAVALSFVGCNKEEESEAEEEEESSIVFTPSSGGSGSTSASNGESVPDVGSIALDGLSSQGASLTQDEDESKCDTDGLGVFGLALGGACHTAPFASHMLLGSEDGDHDGDGDTDCADFQALEDSDGESKGPGLLLGLICRDVFANNDNVVRLSSDDDKGDAFAVSFEDAPDGVDAVGSWTHGNAASYPADIRLWGGESYSDLTGRLHLALTDANNGTIYVNFDDDNEKIVAEVQYSNKTDASSCETSPSKDNCNWQDIQVYPGEDAVGDGPPNGFHLRIYAEDKKNPDFIALEGKYRYTQAAAEAQWDGNMSLTDVRTIYFVTVKKGSQIWGKFFFRDENGDLLSFDMGGQDLFQQLSSGYCQNLGTEGEATCTEITPADYDSLWEGESTFATVGTDGIEAKDFSGAPTRNEFCTTKDCIQF